MGKTRVRIVYMGTPEIAADVLKELLSMKDKAEIVGVFTQPDKPVGRKQILTPSPVKELALSEGIPVFQPRRIKKERPVQQLKDLNPDLIVVTAYGQILSEEILNIPPHGCINMHASLLPKYRGAAPIQWSIVRGEKVTGVTAMKMDKGMDTGDILLQKEVEILPQIRQEEEKATYAPIIVKEDGLIDWNRPAQDIDRMIRGFHVWPGAYSFFEDKKLTLLEARIREAENPSAIPWTILAEEATGKKPKFLVQTGDGILEITKLQLQGKKAMAAADFLRGVRQIPEKLGVINDLV